MLMIMRLAVSAVLAWCSLTFAQIQSVDLTQPLGKQLAPPTSAAGTVTALEGPIDPTQYVLGPGDQLEFGVWGGVELQMRIAVGPDGAVSLPSVGVVPVAGLTLQAAQSVVRERSAAVYPRATITLRLVELRRMKVSISGLVTNPGVYEVTPADRLSTLIALAGGLAVPPPPAPAVPSAVASPSSKSTSVNPEGAAVTGAAAHPTSLSPLPEPTQRRVTVTDRAGAVQEVDYLMFIKTGDTRFNPLLKDGDRVNVGVKSREVGVVSVYGAVKSPGDFEYVPGDRLTDIVALAGGFTDDAELGRIVVRRFAGDGEVEFSIDLGRAGPDERGPELQPDDRVFVRRIPDFRPKKKVEVIGEVRYPGVYPIDEGVTTLRQLIEACGGLTEYADLANGRFFRPDTTAQDLEFQRLRALPAMVLTDVELEYLKTRSRELAPEMAVDFEAALGREAAPEADVTLRDGDVIRLPRRTPTVKVTGQVAAPGLVSWEPGRHFEYYIEKCGGYVWNARRGKVRLIDGRTGVWVKPTHHTPVGIGDIIFVPERRTNYWEISKDLISFAAQVATVVAVVRTLK